VADAVAIGPHFLKQALLLEEGNYGVAGFFAR
jgi:hypothetical protein